MLAPRTLIRLAVVTVTAAVCLVAPSSSAAPIIPAWSLSGDHEIQIPTGFHTVAGRWSFSFDGGATFSRLNLGYDRKGRLLGSGSAGFNPFEVVGSWKLDPATGAQTVRLQEPGKNPRFTFDGTVNPDGGDIVGEHTVTTGFASATADGSGPLTLIRTDPLIGPDFFTLTLDVAQALKGKLTGDDFIDVDTGKSKISRGTLEAFGAPLELTQLFENGRISGKVKTRKDGITTGKLRVRGRGWSVKLVGPIDDQGFHAVATVKAGPFKVKGAQLTIADVLAGPPAPPPPPPPPPKNQLDGASAQVDAGQVILTRNGVPSRFFGTKGDLEIQFPIADGLGVTTADPTTSLDPGARRVIVRIGSKTFGTALDPASCDIDVQQLGAISGDSIRVHVTGEVRMANGKKKAVDAIVLAQVQ